ncbi:MAG: hypothetical protein QXU74_03195 [Candidatus Aenigmatarchaeota archaeon]
MKFQEIEIREAKKKMTLKLCLNFGKKQRIIITGLTKEDFCLEKKGKIF